MKVFKQFLVKGEGVLNDSYVSAATDGNTLGLSLHDGEDCVLFSFTLSDEQGTRSAMQTLLGIEKAIAFLRQEGKVPAGPRASMAMRAFKFLDRLTSPRSQKTG